MNLLWMNYIKILQTNTSSCKVNDQMLVFRLWLTLLYLVPWVGGVHDTTQLPACVNHNSHHCAWSEGKKRALKKLPQVNIIKQQLKTQLVKKMFPRLTILT